MEFPVNKQNCLTIFASAPIPSQKRKSLFLSSRRLRLTALIIGVRADLTQRARRLKKFILARTHEKKKKTFPHARNFQSRLKFSFSVWNFHSRLKISIPGPVFCGQRGARNERTIPVWKFHSVLNNMIFSILPLEIEFVQSWALWARKAQFVGLGRT